MKFGINTFAWVSPFSTDSIQLIEKAKKIGFDVFEIAYDQPELIDLPAVKRALEECDLDAVVCTVVGPGRDLSSEDAQIRKSTMQYMQMSVDAAQYLGSPVISGPLYSYVGKTRLLSESERLAERKRAVRSLKELAVYADDNGIKLALEPLNRFENDMINTVDQGLELIEEINHPNVGFLLDSFHMHIEEKHTKAAIIRAGDRVFHFHSCENDRGIPGSGQVDWKGIKDALVEINYQGYLVIETFTQELLSIARAVSLWRPLAPTPDSIPVDGLKFLRAYFGSD